MRLTLERSDGVTAVIFESANPGIENDNDRVARLVHDEALARRIELEGMESFLEYWESLPLFESQHRLPEHDRQRVRRQRLATSPIGAANSMRGLSQGRQLPMWDALAALAVPTLVVAGADDATYARIALRLEQTMPQIRVDIIPSAGHTVHLEQPAAFLASVTTFLKQIDDEERIESRAATAMAAKGNV